MRKVLWMRIIGVLLFVAAFIIILPLIPTGPSPWLFRIEPGNKLVTLWNVVTVDGLAYMKFRFLACPLALAATILLIRADMYARRHRSLMMR